jgi:hypothetical protein
MAIFRAPRISSVQRLALLLSSSEIVYDTDHKLFYGGDGDTVGGFPIGSGVGQKFETVELTEQMILDKGFMLQFTPLSIDQISFDFVNGTRQIYGIDFVVNLSTKFLSWDGLGLDGFAEEGDVVFMTY